MSQLSKILDPKDFKNPRVLEEASVNLEKLLLLEEKRVKLLKEMRRAMIYQSIRQGTLKNELRNRGDVCVICKRKMFSRTAVWTGPKPEH